MAQCYSVTNEGQRCSKETRFGTRYCWHHQDKTSAYAIIGLSLTLFFGIIGVIALWISMWAPIIKVSCLPLKDIGPSGLDCLVVNSGRKEATNLKLRFTWVLPLETRVYSSATEVALIESDVRKDSSVNPDQSKTQQEFYIVIPRVPPMSEIDLTIRTHNPDNIRASNQILYITERISENLNGLVEIIMRSYEKLTYPLNVKLLNSLYFKQNNLYIPADFFYEGGYSEIEYITDDEMSEGRRFDYICESLVDMCFDYIENQDCITTPIIRTKSNYKDSTLMNIQYLVNGCDINDWDCLQLQFGILCYAKIPDRYDFESQ